ncbi:hypothetical protein ODJ79_16050 [Actinoplanes sp. KI2]|uniref:hypothetical protein n=1 Tax=Actinoplanes sp. KI2 TaxID=2983315 RepID=UPI0021D5C44F|nr:hypothetical protein [Actinoplanes sp. KI2]MCU7725242.1 hypothetical protein [Actinoplanes sp. KI2]
MIGVLLTGLAGATPAYATNPCDGPKPPPSCDPPPPPPTPTTRTDVLVSGSAQFDWGNDCHRYR